MKMNAIIVGYTSLMTSDLSREYLVSWMHSNNFLSTSGLIEVGRHGEANRDKAGKKRYWKVNDDGYFAVRLTDSTNAAIRYELHLTPSAKCKSYMVVRQVLGDLITAWPEEKNLRPENEDDLTDTLQKARHETKAASDAVNEDQID